MTDQTTAGGGIPQDSSSRGDTTFAAHGKLGLPADALRDAEGRFQRFEDHVNGALNTLLDKHAAMSGQADEDAGRMAHVDEGEHQEAEAPAKNGRAKPQKQESTSGKREDAPEEESDPKLEKAKRTLRLQGWTDKALEAHSPEEILDLGSKRAKANSDIGKALQENARLRERLEQLETSAPATEAADPKGATKAKDQGASYKALAEQFGEDAAKAFRDLLADETKPLRDELAVFKQAATKDRQAQNGKTLEAQRARLREADPRLSEEAPWKALLSVISDMGDDAKEYDSLAEVFDAAYESVYGEAPNSQAKRQEVSRARSKAQPTPSQRKRAAPKAMTPDEQARYAWDRLNEGVSKDQIKTELARL